MTAAIAQFTDIHTRAQADMLLPVEAFDTVFGILKKIGSFFGRTLTH